MPYDENGRYEPPIRSRLIVMEAPALEKAREGWCRWCGEEIELVEFLPLDDQNRVSAEGGPSGIAWGKPHPMSRRRTLHRGDAWEVGDRNCVREYNQSRCWSARDAVKWVARREQEGRLWCVDCAVVCEVLDDPEWDSSTWVSWEADHEIPIWKGGEHELANFRVRCGSCHGAKTRREAAERAAAKRGDLDVDQLELAS